jgi:hypothetical protein
MCFSERRQLSKRSIADSGRKSENKAKRCVQHGDRIAILSRTKIQYVVPSVVDAKAGSVKMKRNYRDLRSNLLPKYVVDVVHVVKKECHVEGRLIKHVSTLQGKR